MKRSKFLKAPGILAALGAFWASSCFINRVIPPAEGAISALFQEGPGWQNQVGWPIPWMTVYTSSDIRQFGVGSGELLYGGNNGVHINLLALIAMVLLCLVVGGLVVMQLVRILLGKKIKLQKLALPYAAALLIFFVLFTHEPKNRK